MREIWRWEVGGGGVWGPAPPDPPPPSRSAHASKTDYFLNSTLADLRGGGVAGVAPRQISKIKESNKTKQKIE